ncbi:MAG: hypothetical protein V4726_19655 [Verrucomicrobiota bacterium]
MLPPSPDSDGPSKPPKAPPSAADDSYWDFDSDPTDDSSSTAGDSAESPEAPAAADSGFSADAEAGSPENDEIPVRDRSRSLRKPRSEPLSFQPPGTAQEPPARVSGAAPLSPIELAPRPPRADPLDKTDAPPAPVKMPLQRKSGEGVEKFTRFTSRPQASAATGAAAANTPAERGIPLDQIGTGSQGFGKLKENATPSYQSSRLQEVIDHTYAQTSHRRMGRRHAVRNRIGTVLFLLAAAGLGSALVWTWTQKKPDPSSNETSRPTPAVAVPDSANLPPMAERQEVVRKGLRTFLESPGWEAKLPWVLHAERLSGRMKDFYLSQKGVDPEITALAVSQPVFTEGSWWFMLTLENREGPPIRIAARETPEGPRFDWENLVAYGSMPFPVFCSEKPRIPQTLRLRIRPSSVYQGKYNENEYQACEISPRSGEPVLYGYAPLSSSAARQIVELTTHSEWNPSLLSLHWEPDAGSPSAVVIEQAHPITPPGGASPADSPGGEKNFNSSNGTDSPRVNDSRPPASGEDLK